MSKIADPYATALFEVTQKTETTEAVLAVLVELKQSLESQPEALQALKAPVMSSDDKLNLIELALKEVLNEELQTFMKVLARNQRLHELPAICSAFENKVAQQKGVMKGTVKSASELSADEKDSVQKMIEENLNATVDLNYLVDSKMIGGIEAKVGSFIFEDSVKSHMSKLNDYITRRV